MGTSLSRVVRGLFAAATMVFAATLLSLVARANAVTAGFAYLISVLVITIWQGFPAGAIGSILATACFNYFFFPPIGTFQIADPQSWISLGCFLVAAIIATQLVSRERDRASEARSRQREIEALYNLCVDLFTAGVAPGGLDAATSRALATIGAQGGGLVLAPADHGAADPADAWVGSPKDLEMHRLLRSATGEPPERPGTSWRNVSIPVTIGGRRAGDLVAYGTRADRATLESVARLLGLALERERLLAERARLEALKQSDSLKTALLRAVSHDLYTPLTSVLVSIESLKRTLSADPGTAETIDLIAAETSRLHRRIQNLLDLARLQAGAAGARREPTPAPDLFRSARESLPHVAAARRIATTVEPGCPDLDVDPSLALEILVNLIENAHRASPPGLPIGLAARPRPGDPGRVLLEVLDRGPGFSEPAAGDTPRKGLGLEIARSFAGALQGSLSLLPRDGGGVCARVDLPAAVVSGATLAGSD